VIRLINFDPLLPPELGPQAEFLRVVDAMLQYNETGQKYWRAYNAAAASTLAPKA
jgi:phenylacetic acid degradation operon negative regulatory protein